MKSRILFILHLPPPVHGASMMGQCIHDSLLVNEKFDCRYINLSASENVDEVGKLSVRKIRFLFTNLWHVIWSIIKEKPQLCYLTPTSGGWGFYRDFVMVKILLLFRTKVLLHFHNKASKQWIEGKLHRPLVKSFFKGVRIILLSEELYPERAPFIGIGDVYFCPNGIPSVASPESKAKEFGCGVHFLFLSNMMEEKGVYILLEACAMLHQKGYRTFRCDFVGGWKDITEVDFNNKVEEYDLHQHVKAHGPKYGADKVCFLEQADVVVFPTYYHGETFGLVLLEAMDYSLPCISTDNGAIKSVVKTGETGFCIKQKDVMELVDRMIWMIEHPDQRIRMGCAGKRRYEENFTLAHFERKMTSILNDYLKI